MKTSPEERGRLLPRICTRSALECAGKAKRRRRFWNWTRAQHVYDSRLAQSGVAASLCHRTPNASRVRAPGNRAAVLGCWGLCLLMWLCGCSRNAGSLLSYTFQAPSLSTNCLGISDRQHLVVYLPPSYRSTNRKYPVLYFLPNFTACLWRYTGGSYQGFHLRKSMDSLIATGAAREMIIVIPNTVHMMGGSWYENSPLTGNWEDYVVEDVVRYVDSHFRTIPSAKARALAGHGMGGAGALELGLKHPNVFGCVYAMSPPVFDSNGLADFGILSQGQKWKDFVRRWQNLDERSRRKGFRDYIQAHVNSPSRETYVEGLQLSYAAAFAADLSLPYPHIALPIPGADEAINRELASKYEDGFGGWDNKLRKYLARGETLGAVTIEYTSNDDYAWIRKGAVHLSGLMHKLGIANELVAHPGRHESTLGNRLETAMLPAVSSHLAHE